MRTLLILFASSNLISCISFPAAEAAARKRQMQSQDERSMNTETLPPVGKRDNFSDRYFR